MNKIILIALLLTFAVNTSAYGDANNFCYDVHNGAETGRPNNNYIYAKELWNKLNIHNSENNKPTVSFEKNISTFYGMCMQFSGKSRTSIVINIYSTLEGFAKAMNGMS